MSEDVLLREIESIRDTHIKRGTSEMCEREKRKEKERDWFVRVSLVISS